MQITNPKYFRLAIIFGIFVTIADLISKSLIFSYIHNREVIQITPFFNLVKVYNTGISFGMFTDMPYNHIILPIIAIVISIILFNWLRTSNKLSISLALAAIIGGAFGNVIDRAVNGAVADFLDLHFRGYHWPAFNLADSAITIGVLVLLNAEIFGKNTTTSVENNE